MPAAIGYVQTNNSFTMSSSVQRNADQDWKNGVRCTGSALLNIPVYGQSSVTTSFTGGLAGITAGKGYQFLAPTEIDPRLSSMVACYQYYAFRRICLKYVPNVGTSTTGTLFLGITKDPESAVALYANVGGTSSGTTPGTASQIMDTDPSVGSTIWQPAALEFVHRGDKLWETYANSEEPIVARIQAAIIAILQVASTGTLSTLYGNLFLEYEIDLYVPGPPLAPN
jgi:hypothetical protein